MNKLLRKIWCVVLLGGLIMNAQAQVVNFDETWKEFLSNNKVSNISKLPKPAKASINYPKYCLMYGTTNFCSNSVTDAENYISEIRNFGEEGYRKIPGFIKRFQDLDNKILAYHNTNDLWDDFLETHQVDFDKLEKNKLARRVCEKGTLAKYTFMETYGYYCKGDVYKAQKLFENYVLQIVDRTTLKVSDVEGLDDEIREFRKLFKATAQLEKDWKRFIRTGKSKGFDLEVPIMECNSVPAIKSYILIAAEDMCTKSMDMLEKIEDIEEQNQDYIDDELAEKIAWLKKTAKTYNGDLARLNRAWKDFLPDNELSKSNEIEFMLEYCDKEAQARSYLMNGLSNVCGFGKLMLGKITKLQIEHDLEFSDIVNDKLDELEVSIGSQKDDFDTLGTIWREFLDGGDTLVKEFELQAEYCNIIAQIRSWTIKGHFYYCDQGEHYLKLVEKYEKKYGLEYDNDLQCALQRLRNKVWNCKNYELMQEGSAATTVGKKEQRLGKKLARVLYGELNGPSQACETTVKFSTSGAGVKYNITAYLCQDMDLRTMGTSKYYDKIGDWLEQQVLKGCDDDGICRDGLKIYVESHIAGGRFKSGTLKKSAEMPTGTPFTHWVHDEPTQKETDRKLTYSTENKMELGAARAWTVKQQLDYMDISTKIGVYEHSDSERGREYNRIEIQVIIPNLYATESSSELGNLRKAAGISQTEPEWCGKRK
ncbi:MAG: hypothetical protein ACPGXZ_02395 [Saprospiraceae bacterium]